MGFIDVQAIVEEVLKKVLKEEAYLPSNGVPIAVSARHVHLSEHDVIALFGPSYKLKKMKDLSQPNQFAAEETVIIVGPKGAIERVRVLGPARMQTQVEVSGTDTIKLGINPALRQSGDISGSAPITIVGPKGSIHLEEGLIIAQAHIHMTPNDAIHFGVSNGQQVKIRIQSARPITFEQVLIRVSPAYQLEMHIDTDEANAGLIQSGELGELVIDNQVVNNTKVTPERRVDKASDSLYDGKLLSEADITNISSSHIRIPKTTIITPLARDRARELGKTITSIDG